jgi:hypothetical protein
MFNFERPSLKDLFKKEEVVVVKKEYRRKYRVNWRQFFINLTNLFAFWKKPINRRYAPSVIEKNIHKDHIAEMHDNLIDCAVKKASDNS